MDMKVEDLQVALTNPNLSVENKYDRLIGVKSDIKQKNVPAHMIPSLFHCLRLAISHNNIHIYTAGFATLSHLLKRLFIEELHTEVAAHARSLYPVLLERLGDHKERVRALAAQAFADLWKAAPMDTEKQVLGTALVGRNPKAKEASLTWILSMHTSHDLLFRPYVASLVACLEDADSAVRDTAKSTVVGLFHNAPAHAKADLKREMTEQHVRKSIVAAVLTGLGLESDPATSRPVSRTEPTRQHRNPLAAAASLSRPASRAEPITHTASTSRPASRAEPITYTASTFRPASRAEPITSTRPAPAMDAEEPQTLQASATPNPLKHVRAPTATQSNNTELKQRAPAQIPKSQEGEQLQPLAVSSARELEDIIKTMLPHFEGRETEANWLSRDRGVTTLRRLTLSNAPHEFPMAYVSSMKTVLDGIFKVVNSLRTQLSTTGCRLIQEMARACGPRIDSMVEIIMLHMIKLCGGMKKITAALGNETVDIVLQNVSYTSRILQHVTAPCEERNVQLRVFAAGWLKTLINKQAHHKSTIEHGGGADTLARCIKKGLSDANPGVREAMRSTFWAFARVWPGRSEVIMSNLDTKTRALLEKDPSRPGDVGSTSNKVPTPQKPTSKSTPSASGRSALREAIAAQKKAHIGSTKSLPPRPETAQAALTEPKPRTQKSTLSSAPVRRGVKVTRPATAGPGRRPAPNELRHESPRTARSTLKTPSPTKSTFANGASESPQVALKPTPKSILVKRPEGIKIPDGPVTPDSKSPKSPQSPGVRFVDEVREDEMKAVTTEAPEVKAPEVIAIDVKHTESKSAESKSPEAVAAPERQVELGASHTLEETNQTDESDESEEVQDLERPDTEDSEEIVLTAEELTLGDLHVPKQRIRRRTHQGEFDWNDPLTRRWVQLNDLVTRRRQVSAQSQELKHARVVIEFAIVHIKTGTIDMFGYRKIQGIIAYHDELFETKDRYNEFLKVLLDDLARNPEYGDDRKRMRSSLNYKLQVIKTVRFMFAYNEIWFAENHVQVIAALLQTRLFFESRYYLVNALRQVADDLLYACHLPDLVIGVVQCLKLLPDDRPNVPAVVMGVRFLTKTFKILNKRQAQVQELVLSRVGQYAVHCMMHGHIIARKDIGALCQQVRGLVPSEAHFWEVLGSPQDPFTKSMISYYIYKLLKGL
ncbi:clasp N terminal-domain-containing protein [Aspergillus floccosus]